jgi:hypothetical protein
MVTPYVEIVDRFGRRRRARRGDTAGDGETIHFPQQFMDADTRAVRAALAARYGNHTTGDDDMRNDYRPRAFVRGYAFADAPVVARTLEDAALLAYDERSQRMQNSWRTKGGVKAQDGGERTPPRTASLDELRALADQAWEDRNRRMSNAWRQR